jgi:hypothetical protein
VAKIANGNYEKETLFLDTADQAILKVQKGQFSAVRCMSSKIAKQKNGGRCYDHNFLRFSPISGEKIGIFLKNQGYDSNIA